MNRKEAEELAFTLHEHQSRWDGSSYYWHVKEVADAAEVIAIMNGIQNQDIIDIIWLVGLFHDVMEDCDAAGVDKMKAFIQNNIHPDYQVRVSQYQNALTHDKSQTYSDYMKTIMGESSVVRIVKLADMENNMHDCMNNLLVGKYIHKSAKSLRKYLEFYVDLRDSVFQ